MRVLKKTHLQIVQLVSKPSFHGRGTGEKLNNTEHMYWISGGKDCEKRCILRANTHIPPSYQGHHSPT